MKKLYRFSLVTLFLTYSFLSSGQNFPTSVTDLKDQFDLSLSPGNKRVEDADIILVSDDQREISLHPRSKKNISGSDVYIGVTNSNAQANFRLVFHSDSVRGDIVDRINRKAYFVKSDRKGKLIVSVTDINNVICTEYDTTYEVEEPQAAVPAGTSVVYTLQSYPASKSVAYLDFDGELVEGTRWNGGVAINALPGNFTEADIQTIFNMVSEDYAPFSVNVTTDVKVYNAATLKSRIRCIFTPTKTASPNAGGVAYLNSFTWGDNTPCWVFNSGSKAAGEAASHEIGHTLSLSHDGRTTPKEDYFTGHGNWGPIMGATYSKAVVQFSIGEYNYANNKQDDINLIATKNGFTFKTDDYGNTTANAAVLKMETNGDVLAANNKGLIEKRTDVDMFRFTTAGGTISLTASPATVHPDLDIKLDLFDAQGVLLTSSNPAALAATLSYNLAAGTYYISIDGVGYNLPLSSGYSDYGSLGVYSISGKVPSAAPANILPNIKLASSGTSFIAPATITFTANATDLDGTIQKVEFFNGTAKLGEDLTGPYQFVWSNVAIGNYNITAKATDNQTGVTTSSVIAIVVKKAPCTVVDKLVLYDAVIGTRGSYNSNGFTRDFAFDDDSSTYFDSPTTSNGWVGLELDGIYKITGIRYYPRASYTSRVTGGKFQGSNTPDFSSGVVDLATISSPAAEWNCLTISNQNSFKYVRYLSPANSNGNIAEIEFHGVKTANNEPTVSIVSPLNKTYLTVPVSLTVNVTAGDAGGSISKVELWDGDSVLGFDISSPYQFVLKVDTSKVYHLIARAIDNVGEYALSDSVIVYARNPVCAVTGIIPTPVTILGTTGSLNNSGFTRNMAFDNDTATYFDSPNSSNSWVGLDLGATKTITGVRFFAREDYTGRMLKGRFQVATNAAFTAGVVNVDTIVKVYNNEWNCISFPQVLNYRYFRYLSPGSSYGNIAELQVYVKGPVTSLEEQEISANGFAIYPNPAKDVLIISSLKEIARVIITGSEGIQVMESISSTLQIGSLTNGMYAVAIHFKDGERRMSKLVISK